METNQELMEFLNFILEYIVANFPGETYESRHTFLYDLRFKDKICWRQNKNDHTHNIIYNILHDINLPEKFKYGIHSYLLSDD